MASIFFRKKRATGLWWIKARSAQSRILVRSSLQTRDEAKAALMRRRIELELELRRPELAGLIIPAALLAELELAVPAAFEATGQNSDGGSLAPTAPVAPQPANSLKVADAIACYYRHCQEENSAGWLKNKISYLRAFFGSALVDSITGLKGKKKTRGHFKGESVGEISGVAIRDFLDGKEIGKKTKRHYREMFHDFFAVLTRYGLYTPTNMISPNPVSALPSYLEKSGARITFLNSAQISEQYEALTDRDSLNAAVRIMIGAGLRRSECLWLRKEDFAPDLTYMRVLYREDEDTDDANSLKTGQRPVTIVPALRDFLQVYLPTVSSDWIVPSPRGVRWHKDNFSKALRHANRTAGLSWTCNEYRHTYATDRAREGWSLFRISKEMGNSQAIAERYYAAFIAPEWLQPASHSMEAPLPPVEKIAGHANSGGQSS